MQSGHGRGVDDMALALGEHGRQERPHAVHDAPEVDAQHPLPRRDRTEPRVGETPDARVVAQHVDRAEVFARRIGR